MSLLPVSTVSSVVNKFYHDNITLVNIFLNTGSVLTNNCLLFSFVTKNKYMEVLTGRGFNMQRTILQVFYLYINTNRKDFLVSTMLIVFLIFRKHFIK